MPARHFQPVGNVRATRVSSTARFARMMNRIASEASMTQTWISSSVTEDEYRPNEVRSESSDARLMKRVPP